MVRQVNGRRVAAQLNTMFPGLKVLREIEHPVVPR
jgi:hypothetical protein